ncbi:FAD/NAD-P-binding domain-containing protein [Pluteus cervinus]|uniref:FAD/NAD-P-binding domain-containing protein n=1 Tax=Pluteus cervinus TaxID=181527 RepID=A0ACD3AJP8_9AGAR|nr:FAD/NAD-P-binding domain-containing protein [Pluteus cervinus]
MSSMPEPSTVASEWLSAFAHSLATKDAEGITSAFLPDGWLRDILVFSWDNRSLGSQSKILPYLKNNFKFVNISRIALDDREGLSPRFGPVTPSQQGVSAGFTFATNIAWGQGYFHLLRDENQNWKALSVFMRSCDWRGHEERRGEFGMYGGHTLAWSDVLSRRRLETEESLLAVIVGAGQVGLMIAARLKQMDIPALIIEANARVGDNWRKRYPTLTLHTIRTHHQFLYQPYPKNWPLYTPRDKLADWLEQYSLSQDLVVWTNSNILPTPVYDDREHRWTLQVRRNGAISTLRPRHVILATGTLGDPRMPDLPGQAVFTGGTLHASQYNGGHQYAGKKVVVIGAGNTSADICQDLVFNKAASVTMVQRSTTCIVKLESTKAELERFWPEGRDPDVSDFIFSSIPLGLAKKIAGEPFEGKWAEERKMHELLRERGFSVHLGENEVGNFPMVFERLGGYWIDVGCADLISSGDVKVKQGVEPTSFASSALIFRDGSRLDADIVIFATGYHRMTQTMKKVFGEQAIDRTGEVWGLDEEGEIKGCYRPSGHPGLWYGAGDFYNARFSSQQLALHLKAIELGYVNRDKPKERYTHQARL